MEFKDGVSRFLKRPIKLLIEVVIPAIAPNVFVSGVFRLTTATFWAITSRAKIDMNHLFTVDAYTKIVEGELL